MKHGRQIESLIRCAESQKHIIELCNQEVTNKSVKQTPRRISGTRVEVKLVLAKFSPNALISSFLIKLHCIAEVSCKKGSTICFGRGFSSNLFRLSHAEQ